MHETPRVTKLYKANDHADLAVQYCIMRLLKSLQLVTVMFAIGTSCLAIKTKDMIREPTPDNIMSTILPLAGPPLYRSLGLGCGKSFLAFIALSFALLPFILLKYGEHIRSKSRLEDWMLLLSLAAEVRNENNCSGD